MPFSTLNQLLQEEIERTDQMDQKNVPIAYKMRAASWIAGRLDGLSWISEMISEKNSVLRGQDYEWRLVKRSDVETAESRR